MKNITLKISDYRVQKNKNEGKTTVQHTPQKVNRKKNLTREKGKEIFF